MGHDLINDSLDHPNPARLLHEVRETLAREQADRIRFREWLRPDVKAEFISGEIIVHSPARRFHSQTVKYISFVLEAYTSHFDLGEVAIEKALVELERNDFEPDVCFWSKEVADEFEDDLMYYPTPNLVVEVLSKSTESRDRGIKLRSYEEAGVLEYWIVNPQVHTVEQYLLSRDKSDRLTLQLHVQLEINEVITSPVIHQFSIPVKAFFHLPTRRAALLTLLAS